MGQNLVRVAAWLRLAVVGAGAGILLALTWIYPAWEGLPTEVEGVLIVVLVAFLLMALVVAGLHVLWWSRPKVHRIVVIACEKVLDVTLLAIMLLAAAELLTPVLPMLGALASTLRMEPGFDLIWSAWQHVSEEWGLPLTVAGFATGPLVLLVVLTMARGQVARAARILSMPPPREEGGMQESVQKELGSRNLLLKAYAGAKDLLEASRKDLAFLSLDIVGSTSMKIGEDPHLIEGSFLEYRRLVEGCLAKHNAYKQTWTPDGQMAAFFKAQEGVECGKDILRALPEFNRKVSRLKGDFRLRVGLNRGVVSIGDDTPLEEVSDFVIDVAGHMQKYADVGSLWIPEFVYDELEDQTGFVPVDQEVDGHKVYAWRLVENHPVERAE